MVLSINANTCTVSMRPCRLYKDATALDPCEERSAVSHNQRYDSQLLTRTKILGIRDIYYGSATNEVSEHCALNRRESFLMPQDGPAAEI